MGTFQTKGTSSRGTRNPELTAPERERQEGCTLPRADSSFHARAAWRGGEGAGAVALAAAHAPPRLPVGRAAPASLIGGPAASPCLPRWRTSTRQRFAWYSVWVEILNLQPAVLTLKLCRPPSWSRRHSCVAAVLVSPPPYFGCGGKGATGRRRAITVRAAPLSPLWLHRRWEGPAGKRGARGVLTAGTHRRPPMLCPFQGEPTRQCP